MRRDSAGNGPLGGGQVKAMLALAADWLGRSVAAINAINVFPVPDGDTGSNMAATLNAAVEAANAGTGGAGAILHAAADGALLGARGNSGVILSQIIAGLAEGAEGADAFGARELAGGLRRADTMARAAVTAPKPGTILTVLSDAANVASELAGENSLVVGLEAVVREAKASVERTPQLLPILKEAGVVDSGGLGLAIMLEGCLFYASDTELPEEPGRVPEPVHRLQMAVTQRAGAATALGYCTEFMLQGRSLSRELLQEELQRIGDSVLVVGEPSLLRVHVHTGDPGAALSLGVRHGSLSRVKVDNIDAQHEALLGGRSSVGAPSVSVVAMAIGQGFESLLAGYGAVVVPGGQTFNPSTREILSAIEAAPSGGVILLPNNRNIIAAANQAARLAKKEVRVLATTTIPQGIAALLAYNAERSVDDNLRAMEGAAAAVHTAEITRAARRVSIEGVHADKGQPIVLIDDRMAATASSPEEAVAVASDLIADSAETVTIYYGDGVAAERAKAAAALVISRRPSLQVEVAAGGQPHYDYIISAE